MSPALGYIFLSAGTKSAFARDPRKITGWNKQMQSIGVTARQRRLRIKKWFADHNTYKNASPFDQSQFVAALILAERESVPIVVSDFFRLANRYPWETAIARIVSLQGCPVEVIDGTTGLSLWALDETLTHLLLSNARRAVSARRRSANTVVEESPRRPSKDDSQGRRKRMPTKAARTATADHYAAGMAKIINDVRSELPPHQRGNLTAIADRMNAKGFNTRTGKPWIGQQIKRTLERAAHVAERRKLAKKEG